MSILPRSYRFFTAQQWQAGLFETAGSPPGLRPLRPFARTPESFASNGAAAPTVLLTREILWRDDAHTLQVLSAAGDIDSLSAPPGIVTSPRLIANLSGIWSMGKRHGSLLCHEPDTMTMRATVELPNTRLVDLAFVSRDTLGVLANDEHAWRFITLGRESDILADVPLVGLHDAIACTFLGSAQFLVVLAGGEHPRLHWFDPSDGAPKMTLPVSRLLPCCGCSCLTGHDRIFVAASSDSQNVVLVLGSDGNLIDSIPIDAADTPVTGLAATPMNLYLTGPRGLLRYSTANAVPAGAAEITCSFLSPVMQSADPEGSSPWLRAEIVGSLPDGCGVEISVASTDDTQVRDRLVAIADDERLSPGRRIQAILNEPDIWQEKAIFGGDSNSAAPAAVSLAAPLADLAGRFLWVAVTLSASSESEFPSVTELKVLYPGHGLMENLPAIYRFDKLGGERTEVRPNGFARSLVGVLETTTQGLDVTISSLGSNIDPASAREEWLNYVARWLSLPWDDALTLEQKRAIVRNAPSLTRQRGTRVGLELLLQCLFPGTPRRFRVVDTTADFGFAVLGCDSAARTSLPAMLAGFPRSRAEVGRAVLGCLRLPCPDRPDDPTARWLGKVRVDIVATAAEKSAWLPFLKDLLLAMVPAGVSLMVRWISPVTLKSGAILGGSLVLASDPSPHLGSDAVTGLARLPESKPRLSQTGLLVGGSLL